METIKLQLVYLCLFFSELQSILHSPETLLPRGKYLRAGVIRMRVGRVRKDNDQKARTIVMATALFS